MSDTGEVSWGEKSLARKAVSVLIFPFLVAASVVATYVLLNNVGWQAAVVLNVVTVAFFLVIVVLEYLLPHRLDWRRSDGQEFNDIGHSWLGTGLGGFLGNMTIGFVVPPLVAKFIGLSLWPGDWPFALQVLCVYVIADLGRYWQHRLHHMIPFLWRFHALHHSVERMSVFKTSRSHFVERFFQAFAMFALLIAAGCPLEVMVWYIIPNTVVGLMDHSNLDVELGPLEKVIMGPRGHRIHHSAATQDIDRNFGSAIVLWDVIFGTFTDPTRVPSPPLVGIQGDPVPSGFLAQYFSPFIWNRLVREAEAAGASEA